MVKSVAQTAALEIAENVAPMKLASRGHVNCRVASEVAEAPLPMVVGVTKLVLALAIAVRMYARPARNSRLWMIA